MKNSNIDIYEKIVGRIFERVYSIRQSNLYNSHNGLNSSWSMLYEKNDHFKVDVATVGRFKRQLRSFDE